MDKNWIYRIHSTTQTFPTLVQPATSTFPSRMTWAQLHQVQQLQGSWQSALSLSESEMNSQIPSGMLPAKLLLSKNALSINGQLVIVSEMVPVRLLNEQSNFVISVQEPISDGKDPVRLLLAMSKNVKLVHRPISDGKDPLRLFLAMLKYVRLVHKSIAKGKEPDKLLKFRSNNASPNEETGRERVSLEVHFPQDWLLSLRPTYSQYHANCIHPHSTNWWNRSMLPRRPAIGTRESINCNVAKFATRHLRHQNWAARNHHWLSNVVRALPGWSRLVQDQHPCCCSNW